MASSIIRQVNREMALVRIISFVETMRCKLRRLDDVHGR